MFSNMSYVSRKPVQHYFGGGYNNLEKLAKADLVTLNNDMTEYLSSIGKKLSKSFLELDSGIIISKILPKIVEQ